MKHKKIIFLLSTLLLLTTISCTNSDNDEPEIPKVWKEVFELGSEYHSESFTQTKQSVITLSNGNFALVWQDGLGNSSRAFVQIINDKRELLLTTPIILDNIQDAIVEADGSGGFFICGTSPDMSIPETRILVWHIGSDGQQLWDSAGLSIGYMTYRTSQTYPSLTWSKGAGLYISCMEKLMIGGTWDSWIFTQLISDDGKLLWGTNGRRTGADGGFKIIPKGTLDNSGNYIVSWINMQNFRDRYDRKHMIETQKFSPAGDMLWGPEGKEIGVYDNSWQSTNETADVIIGYNSNVLESKTDSAGNIYVLYNSHNTRLKDGEKNSYLLDSEVTLLRLNPEGTPLWSYNIPGTYYSNIIAGDKNVFITYNPYSTDDQRLYIQNINSEGESLWNNGKGLCVTNTKSMGVNYNSFGYYAHNTLTLIWTHLKYKESAPIDIVMTRMDSNGNFLDKSTGYPIIEDSVKDCFSYGCAYDKASRQFLIAFDEYPGSLSSTYSNTRAALFSEELANNNSDSTEYYTSTGSSSGKMKFSRKSRTGISRYQMYKHPATKTSLMKKP